MQWEGEMNQNRDITAFLTDTSGFPQDIIRKIPMLIDPADPQKMYPKPALMNGLMIYIHQNNPKERLNVLSNLLAKLSFVAETALYMSVYQVLNYVYQRRMVELTCTDIWETMDEIDVLVLHSFPTVDERNELLKLDSLVAPRGDPKRKDVTILLNHGGPARLLQTEEAYGSDRVRTLGEDNQ